MDWWQSTCGTQSWCKIHQMQAISDTTQETGSNQTQSLLAVQHRCTQAIDWQRIRRARLGLSHFWDTQERQNNLFSFRFANTQSTIRMQELPNPNDQWPHQRSVRIWIQNNTRSKHGIPFNAINDITKIWTIVLPFGMFEYVVTPQGLITAMDIFHGQMVVLFMPLRDKAPCLYLDDILHTRDAPLTNISMVWTRFLNSLGKQEYKWMPQRASLWHRASCLWIST